MKVLIVLSSLFLPLFMYFSQKWWMKLRLLFNLLAIVSALIFGNIASLSIHTILKDHTVFMTNIHSLFLNPFFLIFGGYLGVYILYRLLIITIEEA
ncbi:transposase [Alkalihalobacillus alcalophilus ATCC 27647 = CGMCC 1.3604]|uniref:Transposase n=1 Tax=Alkalihalobacillus alcalophilus ATCC 27647 = CGMCC 1.3604 TaxID=1218173 RepID=A0A094WGT7_ALKAL|nr:transposase [Alkalihalobacillus alcalophilus ATCC 27647 = CGMCC 1.3604]